MKTVTVVGTSVAGWHTVVALRHEGFAGSITVVGREQQMPYDRPPLSKDFLLGQKTLDDIRFGDSEAIASLDADWVLGTDAIALRPRDRAIDLSNGKTLTQDAVVLATGLQSPMTPLLERELNGVHELRTLEDAQRAQRALAKAGRVLVVGGGFIGSEVASAARHLGKDVVLIEADKAIAKRSLGPHSEVIRELHLQAGVDVRTNSRVSKLLGGSDVRGVELADGSTIEGDTVFLGLGSVPANGWLRESGLDLTGGVASDPFGRTSIPGVYVAGDLSCYASAWSDAPRRYEHWTSAIEQAGAVARVLMGRQPESMRAPYFWFDLHGHFIQVAGVLRHDAALETVKGDSGSSLTMHRHGDRVVGIIGINAQRDFGRARRTLTAPDWCLR